MRESTRLPYLRADETDVLSQFPGSKASKEYPLEIDIFKLG